MKTTVVEQNVGAGRLAVELEAFELSGASKFEPWNHCIIRHSLPASISGLVSLYSSIFHSSTSQLTDGFWPSLNDGYTCRFCILEHITSTFVSMSYYFVLDYEH